MLSPRRRNRRRTKGTVLLEFALVMPFFLMFFIIMVDISRVMFTQNTAQDAAFAAARAGAQIGAGDSAVQAQAVSAAQSAFQNSLGPRQGWFNGSMEVIDNCSDIADPYFTARVEYEVQPIFLGLFGLFNNTFYLDTDGVSRCEIVR